MPAALAEKKVEYVIPAPELRGPILHVAEYPELELGFDGPAGSGKTFGILYLLHVLLLTYAGAKILVARKRNTDLAGSALATLRESIIDEHEGIRFFGGSKDRPAGYIYPNGSFLAVNGLDRPGKVKSMDFDAIYIVEATDCDLEDIEMCHIRLARRKNSKLPKQFQKLFMCFNPDAPEHFLNQRMESGLTRRCLSRHEDNPFLWDARTQDWTEEGRRYIAELETLTGVLLERMRWGIWSAAHGTVYGGVWDRRYNVIDRREIGPLPRSWPRYLVIDFGFNHPFVCKWYAEDEDGRLLVYREIYVTGKLVEDMALEILLLSGWHHLLPPSHEKYKRVPPEWADPLPRDVICDHDAEDRATFERHSKLTTTPAKKSVSDGIQAVQARLRRAGDGKPRLRYLSDCLVERDQALARRKRPTCSLEEFNVYVWKQDASGAKEEPVKENDHGQDCDRYMIAYKDLQSQSISYFPTIWR